MRLDLWIKVIDLDLAREQGGSEIGIGLDLKIKVIDLGLHAIDLRIKMKKARGRTTGI
jgi:hypothetical protein